MSKLNEQLIKSFAGGQRDRDHPSLLAENEYSRGVDLQIRDAGLGKSGDGRTNKANSPGSFPQGAVYYEPSAGNGFIVQVNAGAVWTWGGSGTTWTRLDAAVTFSNTTTDVGFGILNGRLFIFPGAGDNAWSWDGAAVTLTDEGNTNADAPRSSIICQQAGRLCASVTTSDYIYFSDIFDAQTWDRSGNNKRVPTNGSEPVTALGTYRDEQILAATRNSVHLYNITGSTVANFTRKTLDPTVGVLAYKSLVVIGEDAFFLDGNAQLRTIKRTINDIAFGVSIPISYSNPNLFGRIRKASASKAAGVHFNNYYLLAVPFDTDTFNSAVIPFDLLHQKVTPEGTVPACLGEWTNMHVHSWVITNFNGVQQLYYIDSEDGALYLMFDGDTDDSDTIDMEIDTRAYDWGIPNRDKTAHSAEVQFIDSTGTVTLAYAKTDATFTDLLESTVDDSNPNLPIALPFALGSGGVTTAECYTFYRLGRSPFWQLQIRGEEGVQNLKLITLRAFIESMITRC